MAITRVQWTDDDGTGTTGTIVNNASLQAIYDSIEGGVDDIVMDLRRRIEALEAKAGIATPVYQPPLLGGRAIALTAIPRGDSRG